MFKLPFKNRSKLTAFLSVMSIAVVSFVDSASVLAFQTYYKSDLTTELYKVEFLGETAGEQFGSSLATGDINGDNIDDLVVGSPFYSSVDKTWNGKVSVFLGKSVIEKNSFDLKFDSPDVEIYGRGNGDQLGMAVDCGDFNRDGYDDILIGAYNASSGDNRPGKAFLILGWGDVASSTIDLVSGSADMEFTGDNNGDAFGMAVKMADINHDNIDDILIGAPFALSTVMTNNPDTGNVYVYFGSKGYVNIVDGPINFIGEGSASIVFHGQKKGERFGSDIDVGNFIGNTFDDIAISAYFADGEIGKQAGKVYLYSGMRRYKKDIVTYDDVLEGSKKYGWFGFSITSGAIGGDTYSDLFISSFPYADRSQRGSAHVLFGRDHFSEWNPDGLTKNPFIVTFENSDYGLKGGRGDSFLGASVVVGDFDRDRRVDFAVGSPGIGVPKANDPGELYIYHTGKFSNRMPLEAKKDDYTSLVVGDYADDWFGSKLLVLDYNHDGYDDLAVSSRYFDRRDPLTYKVSESSNGKVTILLGHSQPFGSIIAKPEPGSEPVTRGEFVSTVVEKFNIKESRKSFIDNCYNYREFCFYAFMGFSNFDGIKLAPDIVLYPDVPVGSEYYEPVTIATLLGAVSGNGGEPNTPFKPKDPITRIQALKILLGINQLVKPMYKFELVSELGGNVALSSQRSAYRDVDPTVPGNWWYPRFTNFVYDNNLINDKIYFRPDDVLTKNEMNDLVARTLGILGQ